MYEMDDYRMSTSRQEIIEDLVFKLRTIQHEKTIADREGLVTAYRLLHQEQMNIEEELIVWEGI